MLRHRGTSLAVINKVCSMRTAETVKGVLIPGLALILYLILSLIFFGTRGDYEHAYLGEGGDPFAYIWFLNWWPWAIAHGINPFVSHYVWYPEGFNMTWAGSFPFAALIMWPVTWLKGAVFSYNILSLIAPALSGWTAFLLARYLTRDILAALVGGYLFGFSSYELGQMLGHLNLGLIFVVPLLVLFVLQRLKGDLSRTRFVASLAIALLIQLGLSTEILATACVLGALTWLIFLLYASPEGRLRLWALAREIVLAAGIMAVVATPFLYFVLKGLGNLPTQINSPEAFSADLLNYIVPTPLILIGGSLFADIARRFTGNMAEQGAYLGLPLILVLVLHFRNSRVQPYFKPLLVSLVAILVLSLGPSLHVAGVATTIWLPWRLALHLPLIHQALPTRLSMYVALGAGLSAALWSSDASSGRERAGRFTLAMLACLCLVPNPDGGRWATLPLEPFFEPENVVRSLGQDANVLILPYGYTGPSMIWQWQSGMRFSQSGGYLGPTPPSTATWPAVKSLYTGVVGPDFANDISGFCVAHKVSAILIAPGTPETLVDALHALNWDTANDHGIQIVRVPNQNSLCFHYIAGDYWPLDKWMGKQVNVVVKGQSMRLRISGRDRSPQVGPVEVRVANGSNVARYQIGSQDTQVVRLPPDCSVTVTASATWEPEPDTRAISVHVSLEPDVGGVEGTSNL